jgi:predicted helicase
MKLDLQLKESGYDFQSAERLRIYLTNTLEEAHAMTGLPLFTQWIAEEANAASDIKKDAPVMVVLGNPPYSYDSENKGEWISSLVRDYYQVDGAPLGERNPKGLQDDYVKFIRFAQWRIEQTGYGILAFISNNAYLDNPTFRGMRQRLMQTFNDIYILDLHGNSKRKEKAPDGSEDKNVFDIQQGVAIGIFIKRTNGKIGLATVHHADLWGKREIYDKDSTDNKLTGGKYHWLCEHNVASTEWATLATQQPFYLFIRQNIKLLPEYEQGWKITDLFLNNNVGIVTARDALTICNSQDLVWSTINDFISMEPDQARSKYYLDKDSTDWAVKLAQNDIRESGPIRSKISKILYRPFDIKYTYYTGKARGFHSRTRKEIMQHIVDKDNLALITVRQVAEGIFNHAIATNCIIDNRVTLSNKGYATLLPLYLYTDVPQNTLFDDDNSTHATAGRKSNLATKFIEDFAAKLKMKFISDGKGDRKKTFGPEDIFSYMYAVFHSPTYRSRYAEFLKMDFPRLPLTSNPELFRNLCSLGDELVSLHLMEKHGKKITGYTVTGDSAVETVRYTEPQSDTKGRVWINATQYFEGVSKNVWEFHVGGYQVCAKWLKDRKGRKLTYDDLTHYQQIVSALAETIKLMEQIDAAINASGGWPIT